MGWLRASMGLYVLESKTHSVKRRRSILLFSRSAIAPSVQKNAGSFNVAELPRPVKRCAPCDVGLREATVGG